MVDDVEQVNPAERSQLKCTVDLMPYEVRQMIERVWKGIPAGVCDENGTPTNYVTAKEGPSRVRLILLDLVGGPRNQRQRIALVSATTDRRRRKPTEAEINDLVAGYADMEELERDSSGEETIVYGVPRVAARV